MEEQYRLMNRTGQSQRSWEINGLYSYATLNIARTLGCPAWLWPPVIARGMSILCPIITKKRGRYSRLAVNGGPQDLLKRNTSANSRRFQGHGRARSNGPERRGRSDKGRPAKAPARRAALGLIDQIAVVFVKQPSDSLTRTLL
jgi:hypothetical protein